MCTTVPFIHTVATFWSTSVTFPLGFQACDCHVSTYSSKWRIISRRERNSQYFCRHCRLRHYERMATSAAYSNIDGGGGNSKSKDSAPQFGMQKGARIKPGQIFFNGRYVDQNQFYRVSKPWYWYLVLLTKALKKVLKASFSYFYSPTLIRQTFFFCLYWFDNINESINANLT